MGETFLVSGVLGCIGAWAARTLLDEGVGVVGYDLGADEHRLELVLEPGQRERLRLVRGDISDLTRLERALDEHEVTNVVHLAALQVPFCRADPPLGARVNVVGTACVFEAVKRRAGRIHGVAYASSAAVYNARGEVLPGTHYGVTKVANEGTAHVYWQEDRVPSLALRPYTVYGPGRDQGVTSAPTQAMLAAARGEGYRIPFGGRTQMHYVRDVARAFVAASRSLGEGARVYDFPGGATHMRDVVAVIEAAAPEVAGRIELDDVQLPFPPELPGQAYQLDFELTRLEVGVRETIQHLRGRA